MREVVLVGACRTAVGKFGGSLKDIPAVEFGALVIREALQRAGIKPEMVDEVILGCVLTGALGQNPARQAMLKAGIPQEVPAVTINKVCGSGLKSVAMAAQAIQWQAALKALHLEPPPVAAPTEAPKGAEQRLEELERLYQKGLVTAEEYRTKRAEILKDL